jgi:hypothetical protein
VSPSFIKNAFIKAKIMTLKANQEAVNEIKDLGTKVA